MIIYIPENEKGAIVNSTLGCDNVSSVKCIIHIIGEGDGTAFTEIGTAADPDPIFARPSEP